MNKKFTIIQIEYKFNKYIYSYNIEINLYIIIV